MAKPSMIHGDGSGGIINKIVALDFYELRCHCSVLGGIAVHRNLYVKMLLMFRRYSEYDRFKNNSNLLDQKNVMLSGCCQK